MRGGLTFVSFWRMTKPTPIKNSSFYVLTESGYVYNLKTKRRLKREWARRRACYKTRIFTDAGFTHTLYHDDPTVHPVREPSDELMPVEGYPNYRVTNYGAVWRLSDHHQHPVPMTIYQIGGVDYVRLRTKDGKRHHRRVKDLLKASTLTSSL